MQITSHSKIYFIISAILVLASLAALGFWGLKLGIDFTGGSLMEIEFSQERLTNQVIQEKLAGLNLGQINIQPTGEKGVILRLKDIDEETHQVILEKLGQPLERRFTSIGPIIGQELKTKAVASLGLALIAIILYIAWAFRKISKPVPSWRYGIVAMVTLFHDILITCGLFACLGHWLRVEIGLPFVAALLTILGYSVNNTIVIFDRTRENLLRPGRPAGGPGQHLFSEKKRIGSAQVSFKEIVNQSINQSISRCINTALTTLFVLLAIFFFGGESIRYFVLALMTGLVVGTYSSIFIASPLIVTWEGVKKR